MARTKKAGRKAKQGQKNKRYEKKEDERKKEANTFSDDDREQNEPTKEILKLDSTNDSEVKKKGELESKVTAESKDETNITSTSKENTNDDKSADDGDDEEDGIISNSTFESLGVCEPLCEAIKSLNWTHASRIQKEALPSALAGRDIIGLAETGSGKTGAFAIPILQSLLENPQRHAVYALILSPTRELAFQIHEVMGALGTSIGATSVCIVGGVDQTSQSIALARNPHVVIATPGRLIDHLSNTRGFHMRKLKYLVMDEADRMLSMDFEDELDQILDAIPDSASSADGQGGGRRTMLFSATMTSKVQKLQRASLVDPVRVQVSNKFQTPAKLLQSYLFIPAKYKDVYLTYLINEHAGQSLLVFGATCNNVQRLALMLRNLGFPAVCLHGQMSQPNRLGALAKFKSGGRDIMICTDVASRGLDMPSVDLVINFDLPGHGKDYIHRVGRTARAGKSGKAIAMVTQYDVEVYQRLESLLGRKLPECKLNEETVLILHERVNEAQRLATRELKEQLASRGDNSGRRKRKGRNQSDDNDGGVESIVKEELRKRYAGGSGGRGGALHNQRGSSKKGGKKKKGRY